MNGESGLVQAGEVCAVQSLDSHKSMAPLCGVCILALVWGFQDCRFQWRAQSPSPDCWGSLGDGLWALLACGWASKGRVHLCLVLPSQLSVPLGAGWALGSGSHPWRFALSISDFSAAHPLAAGLPSLVPLFFSCCRDDGIKAKTGCVKLRR